MIASSISNLIGHTDGHEIGDRRRRSGQVRRQCRSLDRVFDDVRDPRVRIVGLLRAPLAGQADGEDPGLAVLAAEGLLQRRRGHEILQHHDVLDVAVQAVDECAVDLLVGRLRGPRRWSGGPAARCPRCRNPEMPGPSVRWRPSLARSPAVGRSAASGSPPPGSGTTAARGRPSPPTARRRPTATARRSRPATGKHRAVRGCSSSPAWAVPVTSSASALALQAVAEAEAVVVRAEELPAVSGSGVWAGSCNFSNSRCGCFAHVGSPLLKSMRREGRLNTVAREGISRTPRAPAISCGPSG